MIKFWESFNIKPLWLVVSGKAVSYIKALCYSHGVPSGHVTVANASQMVTSEL